MMEKNQVFISPASYEFNIGGEKFIYDFQSMSVKQALAAETLFKIDIKLFSILPSTPSELSVATMRNARARAYGALLIRKNPDGTLESFDPASHRGYEALDMLTCSEYDKLEECREDFFFNMKIASEELMMQSGDIIRLIAGMDKEILETFLKAVSERSASKKKE